MRLPTASVLCAGLIGIPAVPASAAEGDFKLEYRVERVDAAKLGLERCAELVAEVADEAGYPKSVDRTPGQLAVVLGGPGAGKGAFIVYCIAAGEKTVYVIQGIDYRPGAGASAFADRVHATLLKAAQ